MQFGKLHGVVLVVLGPILLALQALLFIAPSEVVSRAAQSSLPNVAYKTHSVSGILGEPEAKKPVK